MKELILPPWHAVRHARQEDDADPHVRVVQIVEAMNKVRADPPAYARKLRQMRPYFTGKSYRLPGDTVPTLTSEGWTAVQAAIDRLNQTPPMPPLQVSASSVQVCVDRASVPPPPPRRVSNERLVQRTLLFGPYFFGILLFAGPDAPPASARSHLVSRCWVLLSRTWGAAGSY